MKHGDQKSPEGRQDLCPHPPHLASILVEENVPYPKGPVLYLPPGKEKLPKLPRLRHYVLEGGKPKPFAGTLPFPTQFRPKESLGSRDPYDSTTLRELWERSQVEPSARFALYRRLSDALGGFFLGLVAADLGLSFREAAWAFLSIVLLIFGYYVLWTLSAQLARYDVNPLLAFLPNAFFAALALYLTWRLR